VANIVLSILGNDKTGDATKSATANLTTVEQLAKRTKGLVLGVGAAAGLAVGAVLKTGFDEAKDASAGQAQLEAGIKSTGGAAGVTVGHMEDLAGSIQGMSGQTDDSIVKAQQLLLTFTGIKNQGPNKIFDEATLAASNMAAKMGGDAASQAMMLGKALNDPEKGISKLTKVGVTFTDSQKAQVAAMVKSGDTAGAQKIILGELSKEFGGAAKAAGESLPGQMARAQRSFEDLSQGVVQALLPIMSAVLPTLIEAIKAITPVLTDVAKGIAANKELIVPFAIAIGILTAGFWAMSLTPVALMFAGIVIAVGLVVAAVVLLITHWSDVVGFFRDIWGGVVSWFQGTLDSIGTWWSTTWDGIVGFFRGVLDGAVTLFQNWTLVGIIATHWTQIVTGAQTAWTGLLTFIGGIPKAILDFFTGIGQWLYDAGSDLLGGLLDGGKKGLIALGTWELGIGKAVIGWLSDAATWLVDTGSDILHGALSGAKNGISDLSSWFGGLAGKVGGWLADAGDWLVDTGSSILSGALRGVRGGVSGLSEWFGGLGDRVGGWIGNAGSWLFDSGKAIIQGLIDGIGSMVSNAGKAVSGVMSHIASFFPHSPAENGPFSGAGWTAVGDAGAAIVDQLSGGFTGRAAAAGSSIGASMNAFMPAGLRAGGTNMTGMMTGGGTGPLVHIDTFTATPEQSPADIAAGLGWLARGGL
jgi:hypothetical protein